jgi:hypothetical protein
MQHVSTVRDMPPGASTWVHGVRLGKRFRILLPLEATVRSLLFLNPTPDGSLVCGPGKFAPILSRSSRRLNPSNPLPRSLVSDQGDRPCPPDFHLTFHASGIVNSGGARTYKAPFAESETTQLCRVRFRHPGYLREVTHRPSDVVLPGELRTTTAVEAALTILPNDAAVFFAHTKEQVAFVFRVLRAPGDVAYSFQLSLLAADDPWPQETTFEWASKDGPGQ